MEIKYYGQPDPDPTLEMAVIAYAEGKGCKVLELARWPRVEAWARPCKHPLTLTIEFTIDGIAGSARQERDGSIRCPLTGG